MAWLNQEVVLTAFYAGVSDASSGPLRRGNVGIVDQANTGSESVHVTSGGRGYNYNRKALRLADSNHIRGAARCLIPDGHALCIHILDSMLNILQESPDADAINAVCNALIAWNYDHSVLESALIGEMTQLLVKQLASPSLSIDTLALILQTISVVGAPGTPVKLQALYLPQATNSSSIIFEKQATSQPFYVFNQKAKGTVQFTVYTRSAGTATGISVRRNGDIPSAAWTPSYTFYAFTSKKPGTACISYRIAEDGAFTNAAINSDGMYVYTMIWIEPT